jgi:hypothetical protein
MILEHLFKLEINYVDRDLLPENKTMTLMRFPIKYMQWRSNHEETLYRRTDHKSDQTASRVVRALEALKDQRGLPKMIRVDR